MDWLRKLKELSLPVKLGFSFVIVSLLCYLILFGYADKGLTGFARFIRDLMIFAGAGLALSIANQRSLAAGKQAEIQSKRHSSETFTQAIQLLAGQDNQGNPAVEVRIGGIYALESLALADAKNYAAAVMKTLVAYIRENAQKTALPAPSTKQEEQTTTNPDHRKKAAHLGEDVKTAFAALKRLHNDKTVLEQSGLQNKMRQKFSFAYADFRALRMDEIRWIDAPNLMNANLQGADLNEANLQGAHLSGAQLQGAHLSGAQLQGAHLSGAQLQGALLGVAYLQRANLMGAHLQRADLREAHLQGANLTVARLQEAKLGGAYLQEADLSTAHLPGAGLREAHLQGTDLSGASLQGTDLREAHLQGADLREAHLQGASLRGAYLSSADLSAITTQYTSFEDANFEPMRDDELKELEEDLESLPEEKKSKILDSAKRPPCILDDEIDWHIWHSGEQVFSDRSIASLDENIEWDLARTLEENWIEREKLWLEWDLAALEEKIWVGTHKKAFLKGVLRNFAERREDKPSPRAVQCRRAVLALRESHEYLWNELDSNWTDWLSSLNADFYGC